MSDLEELAAIVYGELDHDEPDRVQAVLASDWLDAVRRKAASDALRGAAGAYLHDYPEVRDDLIDRADRIALGVTS